MTKPYFEDKEAGITIYHGDCLQIMKDFADKSFSLVLTDPPYNISNYGNSLTKKGSKIVKGDFGEWDKWNSIEGYFSWCIIWAKQIDRIIKNKGSFYVFFDNHYADHLTYLIEKHTGFAQKTPIVLVKNNPIPHIRKTNFRSTFERATLFVKDKDKKPKTFNFQTQKEMVNAIHYNIGQKNTTHPTEKPLKVINLFVRVSSNKNDIVLDPFLGSGTTAVACAKLHRNFIGIEISKKYCEIAVKRIKKETEQRRLF